MHKAQQHEHVFLFTISGVSHCSLFFKVHLYLTNYFLECIYVLGDQSGRSSCSFQIISFGKWCHPIFILLTNAKINLTHCCCNGWISNSNFFCLNIFSFYPRCNRRRTSHLERLPFLLNSKRYWINTISLSVTVFCFLERSFFSIFNFYVNKVGSCSGNLKFSFLWHTSNKCVIKRSKIG